MSTKSGVRAFTGRSRRKQTPWTVRAADIAAKMLITVGGIGTILAVSLVFLFLLAVAIPLFFPGRLTHERHVRITSEPGTILAHGVDEFRSIGWTVSSNGEWRATRLDTGETLFQRPLLAEAKPTVVSQAVSGADAAVGAADGTVRFGTLGFTTTVHSSTESVPEGARQLVDGELLTLDQGVWARTPHGQWRLQSLDASWGAPVSLATSALRRLDYLVVGGTAGIGSKSYWVAFYADDGSCKFCKIVERENQITGEKSLESREFDLPVQRPADAEMLQVLLTSRGDNIYLVWSNGRLQRLDVRNTDKIEIVEETDLLGRVGGRLTDCRFMIGRETLIVADSRGGLRAWFRTRHQDEVAGDGQHLTMVHDLTVGPVAAEALHVSERGRSVVAGYADGMVRVFHVTTEKRVIEQPVASGQSIRRVAFTPKEDGLMAATDEMLWTAQYDPRHPEVTLYSLFGKVWYEGHDRPLHMWQSSSATSAPEPKFGLAPLMFGTIKATFYTLLFAAPLSLLAAIYTSEFMHPRTRVFIKPAIEMMASLPSVVLGFLAALVFAPFIKNHVTATITALYSSPFLYLLAAHIWQALPPRLFLRWQRFRLALLFCPLPIGVVVGWATEPMVERWLFAGDVVRWLDRQIGHGIGAWLLLWLPLCALASTVIVATWVNPWLRSFTQRCSRGQYVFLSLAKFLLASAFTVALAAGMSWLLDTAGWDPRGSYVGTYDQRNALVVGVVMGFAVIPIIYTIADDALNTVPQHLRSASLGCGATPWQTAMRVVVPTAMSGLFSALMIGLGRAVGETMIVLMAGGNTPVMDWNVFNGFKTLSANIATELPEAVRDSTHYRTLFLAALTLFLLTFCVNTLAELVRLRFRKQAYQL